LQEGTQVEFARELRCDGADGVELLDPLGQGGLHLFTCRDVPQTEDDGGLMRFAGGVLAENLDRPPRPVLVPGTKLDVGTIVPRGLQEVREGFPGAGQVVWMDEGEPVGAHHFVGAVSEHTLDRGTGKADEAVGVGLRNDIDAVLDQPAVSVHALREVGPCLCAAGP
jgi:hypothetical protein